MLTGESSIFISLMFLNSLLNPSPATTSPSLERETILMASDSGNNKLDVNALYAVELIGAIGVSWIFESLGSIIAPPKE